MTATLFTATIERAKKTATGIPVPEDAVEALGAGRQPRVRVTLAGHTYHSRVTVRSGRFKIPLRAANRALAGVSAGQRMLVRLELDCAPRERSKR